MDKDGGARLMWYAIVGSFCFTVGLLWGCFFQVHKKH